MYPPPPANRELLATPCRARGTCPGHLVVAAKAWSNPPIACIGCSSSMLIAGIALDDAIAPSDDVDTVSRSALLLEELEEQSTNKYSAEGRIQKVSNKGPPSSSMCVESMEDTPMDDH